MFGRSIRRSFSVWTLCMLEVNHRPNYNAKDAELENVHGAEDIYKSLRMSK